jgi:hypothetical protein
MPLALEKWLTEKLKNSVQNPTQKKLPTHSQKARTKDPKLSDKKSM